MSTSEKDTAPPPPPKKSSIAEKVLKRKQDPELQKKLKSEQLDIKTESAADIEINEAVAQTKLKAAVDKARKQRFKYGGIALGVLVLGYFAYGLFVPYKAGLTFGVCKIFLELNTRYPHTLKLSTVEEINDFVRIWYTQTDAFGEYRLENIQCTFEPDEQLGGRLKKVSFNRRPVDPERVAEFNKILPVIFASPPDLTYPAPIPDSLRDMKIETHRFRRPIL